MYVYILANMSNVAIYVGVTNDLVRRVYEHKRHVNPRAFTARYQIDKLVYFEETPSIHAAIARKNELVFQKNPDWTDLYPSLI